MRPKRPQASGDSGRQVGDTATRNASPETNVKSCGPVMHPFQRSKNPSQVNLFGEKEHYTSVDPKQSNVQK